MNPHQGYTQTEEHKRKISESLSGFKRGSFSEEHKQKLSIAHTGAIQTEEHKRKCAESRIGKKRKPFTEEHKHNMSEAKKGSVTSEETKRKLSAIKQRLPVEEWDGYISFEPYCPKFNIKKKEEIRNEYLRTCVISGESTLQEGRRLSVHHVDNNKMQGCDGVRWRLVPVTRSWNARLIKKQTGLLLDLLLLNNMRAQINLEVKI